MARLAFTGDAGFIDVTVALIDATVNWNLGTGLDQEQVAQGEEPMLPRAAIATKTVMEIVKCFLCSLNQFWMVIMLQFLSKTSVLDLY